jgi:hypothetical protein
MKTSRKAEFHEAIKNPESPQEGAKSARKLPFLRSLAPFAPLNGDFLFWGLVELTSVQLKFPVNTGDFCSPLLLIFQQRPQRADLWGFLQRH